MVRIVNARRAALAAMLVAMLGSLGLEARPYVVSRPGAPHAAAGIACLAVPENSSQLFFVSFDARPFNNVFGPGTPPAGPSLHLTPPYFYNDPVGASQARDAIGPLLEAGSYNAVGQCDIDGGPGCGVEYVVPTRQGVNDDIFINGYFGIAGTSIVFQQPFNRTDPGFGWAAISPQTYSAPYFSPPPSPVSACLATAAGTTLNIAAPQATYQCEPAVVTGARSDGLGLGVPYPAGVTTITWTVQDDGGSKSSPQPVTITGATVTVKKFFDTNSDGVDNDAAAVSGWPITLSGTDSGGGPVSVTVFTNTSGVATFSNVPLGNYTVEEAQPGGGWVSTTPGSVLVSVTDCVPVPLISFGNKFNEADGVEIHKTQTNPKKVVPGQPVTWTVVVTGAAILGVNDVQTSDTVPAAVTGLVVGGPNGGDCSVAGQLVTCSFGNLDFHEVRSYTITGLLAPSFTGDLVNTATATTTSDDTNPGNNTSTATSKTAPTANLSVQKSMGQTGFRGGDPITYTIVVSNPGPSDVPSATVSDVLPYALTSSSWTCVPAGGATCQAGPVSGNIGDTVALPAGSSVVYTLNATIQDTFLGPLENSATVSAAGVLDPDPSNNTATVARGISPKQVFIAVPTLGEWGLALLMALLAGAGALSFARKRS